MGITTLIAIIASVTVSAVALSKEVHMASFVNQLSKNVSVALTMQEIIDKKIENKVNALEETVLLMGQEITNLKVNMGTVINSNYWRIEGIKNVYNVFQEEVIEKFNKDFFNFIV